MNKLKESYPKLYGEGASDEEMDNFLKDTLSHIEKVQFFMRQSRINLQIRAIHHDRSKFSPEEAITYAKVVPEFKLYDYGSPEYDAVGDKLSQAWIHHESNNDHHPGFHKNGVDDMNLFMVLEMLCDWKAASMRNPNQDFKESLKLNIDKYNIGAALGEMLIKTAEDLNMFDEL